MEVASVSTARRDVNNKPAIYARIGVPEYWRFDPSGGRNYGQPLYGGKLVGSAYQEIGLTTEPDGILKAYSEVLELSLCWDEGWPRFYDPSTGSYLENWRQVSADREAERTARRSTEAEVELLRERLRHLESDG